jgi:hypothetical protein
LDLLVRIFLTKPEETFFEDESEGDDEEEIPDDAQEAGSKRKPRVKTQSDINRKMRARQLKEEEKLARQKKKMLKDVNK